MGLASAQGAPPCPSEAFRHGDAHRENGWSDPPAVTSARTPASRGLAEPGPGPPLWACGDLTLPVSERALQSRRKPTRTRDTRVIMQMSQFSNLPPTETTAEWGAL